MCVCVCGRHSSVRVCKCIACVGNVDVWIKLVCKENWRVR